VTKRKYGLKHLREKLTIQDVRGETPRGFILETLAQYSVKCSNLIDDDTPKK
jgi:hypothetical protein